MKICVIGLGYIGLPTAAMFARAGMDVLGVDRNSAVTEALNEGRILIEEEGLAELIREVVDQGRLRAAAEPEEASAFIIAVPTPIREDKRADMSYVESASRSVIPYLRAGNLVVLESTSPVGTVDELMKPILEESGLRAGLDFFLGHSPERVIPGSILRELVANDRIAGGVNEASAKRIADLYRAFVQGQIYETDARTAELCKLSENTYRDVNIAFANELAKICEAQGIDVWNLIRLCNRHPRVNIHQPGPGVGGHCIAVDPWFIVEKNPEQARIIRLARDTNDGMPPYVAEKVSEILKDVTNPVVGVLGITYKPDVDDTRESPILTLMDLLQKRGVAVRFFDPHVSGRAGASKDALEAAAGCDLLVLGVNHQAFRSLDYQALAGAMRSPVLLDTRNCADAEAAARAGFTLYSLGR